MKKLLCLLLICFSANVYAGQELFTTDLKANYDSAYTHSVNDPLIPSQTGNTGKFLTTNGSSLSFAVVDTVVAWGEIIGTLANQTDLNSALSGKEPANANIQSHIADVLSNPHSVTYTQTGALGATQKATDSDKLDNLDSTAFAPAASGVTNGDGHDHIGGDGATIDHLSLSNAGTYTHTQIDAHIDSIANPHSVSYTQIGAEQANANIQSHISDVLSNPHAVTYTQTGGTPASRVEASTAAGQMLFGDGAGGYDHSETSELFWDDTNKRLGIGTTSPSEKLEVDNKIKLSKAGETGGLTISAHDISNRTRINTDSLPLQLNATSYSFQDIVGSQILNIGSNGYVSIGKNSTISRRFEVLDDSNPQLRLTHTDNSVYTDFQTDSSGYLNVMPSGSRTNFYGNIVLENTTTSGTGVITKNGTSFIHNFQHPTGNTAIPIGRNVFIGENAGNFTMGSTATSTSHGSYNSAIGYQALYSNTTGYFNSAIGYQALYSNTTGFQNSAIGYQSLFSNTTGRYNSAFGYRALYSNTTGLYNSAIGYNSGRYLAGGATERTTGDYGLYLGVNTKASANDTTNENVFGYNATGNGSNTFVFGDSSILSNDLWKKIRLQYTKDSVYTDFQTDSSGNLSILPSGNQVLFLADNLKTLWGADSDMSMYYDGTSAYIKTNEVTASDLHITTGAAKTLILDTTVYDDIRIIPGSFDRIGISDPSYVAYSPTGGSSASTYLTEWQVDDIATFTAQIPHSYKAGGSIYAHVHWTPGLRGNEEAAATVGWKLDCSWANIGAAFGDMVTYDLSDAVTGTDNWHEMTTEVELVGTGKTYSSMLMCNIKRTDTGTDDTWAGTASGQLPMLLEVDFHYPIDRIGTTN
jgi:hypothetical protein